MKLSTELVSAINQNAVRNELESVSAIVVSALLVAERLGQELDRAGLHRPYAHGNIAVTCNENDGKVIA